MDNKTTKIIKILSYVSFSLAVVSLIVGASFHGFRMNPENEETYSLGVNMGISMICLFAFFLVAGIILFLLSRKAEKRN